MWAGILALRRFTLVNESPSYVDLLGLGAPGPLYAPSAVIACVGAAGGNTNHPQRTLPIHHSTFINTIRG